MVTNIFVYGSLMSGFGLNGYMQSHRHLSATLEGEYTLLDIGPYPGLMDSGMPGDQVLGELYQYDEETIDSQLIITDGIELGAGYERVEVEVEDRHGLMHQAYTYIYVGWDKERLDPCIKWGDLYSWRYNECVKKMKQFTKCPTMSLYGRTVTTGASPRAGASDESETDGSQSHEAQRLSSKTETGSDT